MSDQNKHQLPVETAGGVKVMSIGFLLPTRDDAVIWRWPRKYGLIRQFLLQVGWSELDFLVIDAPPGTGDEPMAVAELQPTSSSQQAFAEIVGHILAVRDPAGAATG